MICPHCGCFFCDDSADMILLGSGRKIFCSKTCKQKETKKKAQAKQRQISIRHARGKSHYKTISEARFIMFLRHWKDGGIYYCCELGYQITRDNDVEIRP